MKKSDFHYDLPAELIAQPPLAERSASRLLLVPPAPAAFTDRQVRDLPSL
ncbi:tRNA preQ1(34) S-adenosylmethionine ribosyltransferase-isomerase QueA, partial [Mesorhizobium sp. M1C.F.Ca.ET.189.01.1.1]